MEALNATPSCRNKPLKLSPARQELLAWFRTKAVPLAVAYEGVLHLLDDGTFPGRIHFIAHAVRDIADRLVFALDPQLDGSRVQYEKYLDDIMRGWPGIQNFANDGCAASKPEVQIPYAVAKTIDSLVSEHRLRRERPSSSDLLFRYLMRNEPSKAAVNQRLVEQFKGMRKWFMDRTHFRADRSPQVDEKELQKQFDYFEKMLHSFVGDFFTGTAQLDAILQQANQRTD